MLTIAALLLLLLFAALVASGNGWSNVLSTERNELVFADRNQDYGAYVIRREHHRVMIIAFFTAIGLLGTVLFVPRLLFEAPVAPPTAPPVPTDHIIDFVFDPPKTVARPKAPRTPRTVSTAVVPTGNLVAADSMPIADKDTTDLTALHTSSTGDPTTEGGGSEGGSTIGDDGTDDGAGTDVIIDQWKLDEMPAYPGGMDALYADLRRIIRYPEDDIALKRQGRVHVTFVVDEYGHIDQVQVLQGVSGTLNAEAARAVRLLKKRWSPGKYQGRHVKVRFNLPIHFQAPRQ